MSNDRNAGLHQPYFIITWVQCGIATLLMAARCYTAWRLVRHTEIDLCLAIATYVLGAASMVLMTIAAAHGLGLHTSQLTPEDAMMALLYGWLNQFVALLAIGLGKVAIVAFIIHIQGIQTWQRNAFLCFVAGSGLVVNILAAILLLLQCSPTRKLWDGMVPGHCHGRRREQVFGYFQGSYSAFCDIALAIYPMFIFWRVQAFPTARRIGLCILMGFGIVAGACGAVKTSRLPILTSHDDWTHSLAELIVWNQTEMWLVFIVGCIPTTKPFFMLAYRKSSVNSLVGRLKPSRPSSRTETESTPVHDL